MRKEGKVNFWLSQLFRREKGVKLIFDCHNYSKEKKVKLIIVEFIDYTRIWWDQFILSRGRNHERPTLCELDALLKW
jgi:hypothetical protein